MHIPPGEFVILLLASPTLGVIAGAVAYTMARRADRGYASTVQEGQLALFREAQRTAVYMKADVETLEFRTMGADVPAIPESFGCCEPVDPFKVQLNEARLPPDQGPP
jgi:hypothetical protein